MRTNTTGESHRAYPLLKNTEVHVDLYSTRTAYTDTLLTENYETSGYLPTKVLLPSENAIKSFTCGTSLVQRADEEHKDQLTCRPVHHLRP